MFYSHPQDTVNGHLFKNVNSMLHLNRDLTNSFGDAFICCQDIAVCWQTKAVVLQAMDVSQQISHPCLGLRTNQIIVLKQQYT